MPRISKQAVENQAKFLRGWAKGRPVRLYQPGSTFWVCGKLMCKLSPDMVQALIQAGAVKSLSEGWIGWKKEPKDIVERVMFGTAPPYDLKGCTQFEMVQ